MRPQDWSLSRTAAGGLRQLQDGDDDNDDGDLWPVKNILGTTLFITCYLNTFCIILYESIVQYITQRTMMKQEHFWFRGRSATGLGRLNAWRGCRVQKGVLGRLCVQILGLCHGNSWLKAGASGISCIVQALKPRLPQHRPTAFPSNRRAVKQSHINSTLTQYHTLNSETQNTHPVKHSEPRPLTTQRAAQLFKALILLEVACELTALGLCKVAILGASRPRVAKPKRFGRGIQSARSQIFYGPLQPTSLLSRSLGSSVWLVVKTICRSTLAGF